MESTSPSGSAEAFYSSQARFLTAMADQSGARGIEGVTIVSLRRIPDERGTILHMLRSTDEHFISFGEIYFSTIYRGVVKGWHKHREMTLNYACIFGHPPIRLRPV